MVTDTDGPHGWPGNLQRVTAESAESLAQRLADAVAGDLATALTDPSACASLVVSGGSTPAPVFRRLATLDIDWARVQITLADERWVPMDDPASNEALVRNTLMTGRAAAAHFVSLYRSGPDQQAELASISAEVAAMPQPFTVLLLGMGTDGHTASLFPDAPELAQALDPDNPATVMMMHPPSADQARITLTRQTLSRATNTYLHITGVDKRDVLQEALAAPHSLAPPIAPVLYDAADHVSVFWSP